MTQQIISLKNDRAEGIEKAATALRGGRLVVAPTDTIYGLLADAFKPWAISHVFDLKKRPRTLPLPVLVCRPKQAWALAAVVPDEALRLAAAFWPGALTLVLAQNPELDWSLGEAFGTIALRMPARDELLELIAHVGPVAGTSANITGQPTPRTVRGVAKVFGDAVDVYLDGGRSPQETGSTIVDLSGDQLMVLREGPISTDEILAAARGEPAAAP